MMSANIPIYLVLSALCAVLALWAPGWTQRLINIVKRVSTWLVWVAALVMLLLVLQMLLAQFLVDFGAAQSLPPTPLTWFLETIMRAPARSVNGVHASWWLEELRFLSALVMCLPLLALGLRNGLLSVELVGRHQLWVQAAVLPVDHRNNPRGRVRKSPPAA